MDIKLLMKEWSLEEYIEIFEANKIDASVLKCLTNDLVKELIKPIGDRARFLQNLEIWKKIISDDDEIPTSEATTLSMQDSEEEAEVDHGSSLYTLGLDQQTTSIGNSSAQEDNPSPSILYTGLDQQTTSTSRNSLVTEDNITSSFFTVLVPCSASKQKKVKPLLDILKGSIEGRNILRLHKDEGLLSSNSRRKLCNLIVQDLLSDDPNAKVSHNTLYRYAQEIKNIFQKENVGTYFVPYINNKTLKIKTCAKGKLYDCINNRRREYRVTVHKEETLQSGENLQENEQNDDDLQQDILWLNNSIEPWQMVEEKWRKTSSLRLNALSKSNKTVAEYMVEFPCLQTPAGYNLLLEDFKQIFPEKEQMFYENFSTCKDKILNLATQRAGRDPTLKTIIETLQSLTQTGVDDIRSTETKSLLALKALPLLLGNPLGKLRKSSWRPSKQEASDGFITHITSSMSLQSTINMRREKYRKLSITLQPFIIVVGSDYTALEKYYVVVNNTMYSTRTILDAVDVCYKIFHVLNCRYPIECMSTWQFIQKGLYKMQTPWDKNFVCVNSFLTDIGLEI